MAWHRPLGRTPFTVPQMWIARLPDLLHWRQPHYLYGNQAAWETGSVGAGTFVANVVFPTAVVEDDDRLLIDDSGSEKYSTLVEMARGGVLAALE